MLLEESLQVMQKTFVFDCILWRATVKYKCVTGLRCTCQALSNYTGSRLIFCVECVYIQEGFREHELVNYLSWFTFMNNQHPTFLTHTHLTFGPFSRDKTMIVWRIFETDWLVILPVYLWAIGHLPKDVQKITRLIKHSCDPLRQNAKRPNQQLSDDLRKKI